MIAIITLDKFKPVSKLCVKETTITKAKFPVIDVHNHLGSDFGPNLGTHTSVEDLLEKMEAHNIRAVVSLDGVPGPVGDSQLEMSQKYPDKFVTFLRMDYSNFESPDFADYVNNLVDDYVSRGAGGIKFLKELGLNVKDSSGKYIKPCDPRMTPVWQAAARHDIPVLIHIGDPMAFFDPIDGNNERYEELLAHPNWSFADPEFYRFDELVESGKTLLRNNPNTRFIFPHVGGVAEDLSRVSEMLDEFPNLYVDISARLAELGRQPYTARAFFIKYQDRIMHGTDLPVHPNTVIPYYRFYETYDEYFPYNNFPQENQGRWNIYGICLPDEVLKKIYFENACKVIPKLRGNI